MYAAAGGAESWFASDACGTQMRATAAASWMKGEREFCKTPCSARTTAADPSLAVQASAPAHTDAMASSLIALHAFAIVGSLPHQSSAASLRLTRAWRSSSFASSRYIFALKALLLHPWPDNAQQADSAVLGSGPDTIRPRSLLALRVDCIFPAKSIAASGPSARQRYTRHNMSLVLMAVMDFL